MSAQVKTIVSGGLRNWAPSFQKFYWRFPLWEDAFLVRSLEILEG
jgi:hypothetical protein